VFCLYTGMKYAIEGHIHRNRIKIEFYMNKENLLRQQFLIKYNNRSALMIARCHESQKYTKHYLFNTENICYSYFAPLYMWISFLLYKNFSSWDVRLYILVMNLLLYSLLIIYCLLSIWLLHILLSSISHTTSLVLVINLYETNLCYFWFLFIIQI
jgi:dynactin complex subunit